MRLCFTHLSMPEGVVVEGTFGHDNLKTGHPTILSVLGPKHATHVRRKIHIDDAALEYAQVSDAATIAREAAASESGL